MPPLSSLVFVIILAVWAVYLVQHWVRRRDHLATARSVDRFSEAMRVLERRRALPVAEVDAQPRSYAASPLRPARPGRPEVVVKHRGATAIAPSPEQRRSLRAARARAGALLIGSLTMVALFGLAVAGVLPPWSALAGVAVCAVAFTLVRWSVARQRAARRTSRPTVAAPARRRTRTSTRATTTTAAQGPTGARGTPARRGSTGRAVPVVTGPAALTGSAARATGRPATARRHHPAAELQYTADQHRPDLDGHEFSAQSVAATLRTAPRRAAGRAAQPADRPADGTGPQLFDVHAVEASLAQKAAVRLTAEAALTDDMPTGAVMDEQSSAPAQGTWEPVPVPPPTYTLKAKAYRGVPTGSAFLPADGIEMALEEEFEDLPRIDRVGRPA